MVVKMFQHVVDKLPELNKPLSAKYVKSFAYPTFKERIPGIVDGIVSCLKKKDIIKQKYGSDALNEIDTIIQKIEILKISMQTDKPLVELKSNGAFVEEVNVYNKEIRKKTAENNGNPPTWFQTEWLFAECYFYFKLHEIFHTSNSMKGYDPFLGVKIDTLMASQDAILALCRWLGEMKIKNVLNELEKKDMFVFFLKCSLWGNKADLSLSGGKAVAASEDTFTKLDELDRYILVNDVDAVYEELIKRTDNVVDIVLDNAGYELVNDLCFADYLIWSGLAKKVVFHGKAIPWFVSDVTPEDFELTFALLQTKVTSQHTIENVKKWNKYLQEGKWVMNCESFWILPYDYSKMRTECPSLYNSLTRSQLVIFKGDLNYRKLMGDVYWEPTVNFRDALRGFEPTNVLALRTVKADTISGLRDGLFEDLTAKESNWLITGKYGLVQLLKK